MRIGFHLTPFWSPPDRGATKLIDEMLWLVQTASRLGFAWVSVPHHWLGWPSFFPHPFPLIARMAPEAGAMRLKTSVLVLPLMNAVDAAENIATLDHITHGRLDVGIGIGYRETELTAAGITRKDRAPKLEESVELMKKLWTGQEVTLEGRYIKVLRGRMGYTPFQKPYPFLEMGAQSVGATQRAARLSDGVFFGPQVAWQDVQSLIGVFREARAKAGHATPGSVVASRSLIVGRSKDEAMANGKAFIEKTFANYKAWDMQEKTMVPLQLDWSRGLDDWTVYGSPKDCVEAIQRGATMGLDGIGFTPYSLPAGLEARIDYLAMVSEEILKPAGAFTA
jgi:alkanesulfonate monooxygenase SsuD/methylene tetrahydromethanopterin reductase-like flavin-dependent oxidoreductase (luciferase family)